MEHLSWEDFQKVEMRVATVLEAKVFERAKQPAYILLLDFGPFGTKKSSAQLTNSYEAQELIGKQVVAVVNFPPKQIANMMSECLVLGALGQDNEVSLITPEHKTANGSRIG